MDNSRKKKNSVKRTLFNIMMLIYFGFCGGVGGVLISNLEKSIYGNKRASFGFFMIFIILVIVLLFASMIVHMYIHEIGHMIFGLLTGYRFQSIRFGSVMFLKTEEGIKIKKFSLAGTGGQCLMNPPDSDDEDIPTSLYNWGGIIVNMLTSILLLALFMLISNAVARFIIGIFMLSGFGMALMNGVPMSQLGNDGYNAINLKKDRRARTAFRLQLNINSALAKGCRVKDMPKEWFDWDEGPTDNALIASGGVMKLNYEVLSRQFEEAVRLGNYLLENVSALANIHEIIVNVEILYSMIMLGEDKDIIKKKFKDNEKNILLLKKIPSIQRLFYAYYSLVEDDKEKLEKALADFEAISAKYPYPTEIEDERELIELVNDRLKMI